MLLVVAVSALLLAPGQRTAQAAKGGTCASFTVFNSADRVVSPDDEAYGQGTDTEITPRNFLLVRGTYAGFDVAASSFEVLDYTLASPITGNRPVEIFERKTPQFAGALTGPLELLVVREHVRLQRGDTGQNLKIQAKDCQEGGLFQHEPEPGLVYEHVLSEPVYTGPAGTGRLCFSNGTFSGYESPEVATRLFPTAAPFGKVSRWQVEDGGRMGMVVGEDAVEGGCNP